MRRRAPLLAVVAALLLALLAWMFLITPQREQRAVLLEETNGIRAAQDRQRLEIARLEEIRDNELEVRAAIARLEQYVPGGTGQPSTIRQIQLAADASGVDITSVTFTEPRVMPEAPSPVEPGDVVAEIPFTLTIEGGYFQGTDFLRRVENELPRALMIDGVAVAEGSPPARFPLLSVTLTARMFAVLPASAVPGATVPEGTATPAPGATATPAPGATATPAPGATATPAPSPTASPATEAAA